MTDEIQILKIAVSLSTDDACEAYFPYLVGSEQTKAMTKGTGNMRRGKITHIVTSHTQTLPLLCYLRDIRMVKEQLSKKYTSVEESLLCVSRP